MCCVLHVHAFCFRGGGRGAPWERLVGLSQPVCLFSGSNKLRTLNSVLLLAITEGHQSPIQPGLRCLTNADKHVHECGMGMCLRPRPSSPPLLQLLTPAYPLAAPTSQPLPQRGEGWRQVGRVCHDHCLPLQRSRPPYSSTTRGTRCPPRPLLYAPSSTFRV